MKTASFAEILGVVLRARREDLELTQKEVAKLSTIPLSTYSRYEAGGTIPTVFNLWQLARPFRTVPSSLLVEIDAFIGWLSEEHPDLRITERKPSGRPPKSHMTSRQLRSWYLVMAQRSSGPAPTGDIWSKEFAAMLNLFQFHQ